MAKTVESAIGVVRQLFDLDHVTFHMLSTIKKGPEAPYVRSTYPADWIKRYVLRGYVMIDPVAQHGFACRLPFFWDDLEVTRESQLLMEDARAHGIGSSGYSVPVVDRDGRRSLLSIVASMALQHWHAFVEEHRVEIIEAGHIIHRKAVGELYGEDFRFPHLSQREVECLSWTAQGKDAGAIALILDLRENTVRAYLKSARYKLNCSTMSQAVSEAIKLRIISP